MQMMSSQILATRRGLWGNGHLPRTYYCGVSIRLGSI